MENGELSVGIKTFWARLSNTFRVRVTRSRNHYYQPISEGRGSLACRGRASSGFGVSSSSSVVHPHSPLPPRPSNYRDVVKNMHPPRLRIKTRSKVGTVALPWVFAEVCAMRVQCLKSFCPKAAYTHGEYGSAMFQAAVPHLTFTPLLRIMERWINKPLLDYLGLEELKLLGAVSFVCSSYVELVNAK